jgi:hypothetical protein
LPEKARRDILKRRAQRDGGRAGRRTRDVDAGKRGQGVQGSLLI